MVTVLSPFWGEIALALFMLVVYIAESMTTAGRRDVPAVLRDLTSF